MAVEHQTRGERIAGELLVAVDEPHHVTGLAAGSQTAATWWHVASLTQAMCLA